MKLYRPGAYCRQEVGEVGLVFIDFADGDSARSLKNAAVRREYISSVDNSAAFWYRKFPQPLVGRESYFKKALSIQLGTQADRRMDTLSN
jgi:hypothetical protein